MGAAVPIMGDFIDHSFLPIKALWQMATLPFLFLGMLHSNTYRFVTKVVMFIVLIFMFLKYDGFKVIDIRNLNEVLTLYSRNV